MTVEVAPNHLAIVHSILAAHLPVNAKVWVFGSRVSAPVKLYSDLDLLIDAGRQMTTSESANLSEAFSESDLPWKVDFIDRHGTEDYFLQRIQLDCVLLPAA